MLYWVNIYSIAVKEEGGYSWEFGKFTEKTERMLFFSHSHLYIEWQRVNTAFKFVVNGN